MFSKGFVMLTYIYFFSLFMLMLLSVVTGDMCYISIEKITIFTLLTVLVYAVLAVGGFLDHDDDNRDGRNFFRK